ncbi:MAG: lysylphosphatidylglycerol synthase transmembrane domain-containing protein [Candidatus Shapirobacteria bacterium]|nr:lysylphosphatidylglycerol synthase transmembrane domain-containing protein [Candidatus Shapirobacteria bacterium]
MFKTVKKIFASRIFKLIFSSVLIYLAFRKFDVLNLLSQLAGVKIWFVILNIFISIFFVFLISYRWSLLLIKKPKFSDFLNFAKSSWAASFYGLFVPSMAGTDVVKWLIIDNKYPEISKTKLLGSVFLDRFIGMSTYMFVGFIFVFVARSKGIFVPDFLLVLIGLLVLGCLSFYIFIYFFDINKTIFRWKIFKRWKVLNKLIPVGELVNRKNLGQIVKGLLLSVVSEFGWVLQLWFISWYFGANLSLFSILVYIPVISVILLLPISIAGFGAREQLYLFFFLKVGGVAEGILLTSTFGGILAVLNCLIGGLVTLTPDFKKIDKK